MYTFYSLKYVSQGIIGLYLEEHWYNTIPCNYPEVWITEIENKMSDQSEKVLIEEGAVFDMGACWK